VNGKVSTPHGWVDVSTVTFAAPNPTCKQAKRAGEVKRESGVVANKGPPGLVAIFAKGAAGPKGTGAKGRGGGGLGDLFVGGMKPNPGALKGGSG